MTENNEREEEEQKASEKEEGKKEEANIQLSSTTNIHPSPLCWYFCIVLGIVSSLPSTSLATLMFPPSSLTAVIRVFSEMLDKWPLYFNHAPAAEMWSVVLFISTSDGEWNRDDRERVRVVVIRVKERMKRTNHLPLTLIKHLKPPSSTGPFLKADPNGSKISNLAESGEMAISVSGTGVGEGEGE
jgi:hypothetical protein